MLSLALDPKGNIVNNERSSKGGGRGVSRKCESTGGGEREREGRGGTCRPGQDAGRVTC